MPDDTFDRLSDNTSGLSAVTAVDSASLARPAPIGPGLLESGVWFLGAWFTHAAGLVATAALLVWVLIASGMGWDWVELAGFLETQQFTLLAGEQFVFVTTALLLAWWRLRGRLGQRLGSRPLPLTHLFLLTCLLIPLSTVCSLVHVWGMEVWTGLLAEVPSLRSFDSLQAMDVMQSLSAETPVWAMLLVFAVAPALGEELIFRGVIGRGLVARWGMLPGIAVTSLLFALAHVHPVHILAVLPMGVVLHYVYYTTRSFWAPLYLHFGNNALAVLASTSLSGMESPEGFTFSALLTVTLSLLVFLALLWQTRIHFVQADGSEWSAPRFQLELPVEISLRQVYANLSWQVSLGGLVPLIGFLIASSAHI